MLNPEISETQEGKASRGRTGRREALPHFIGLEGSKVPRLVRDIAIA